MNPEKWDRIAEDFEAGRLIPANGMIEWEAQAVCEAAMIRKALPDSVETLLEVGCGVGRLTPHLAIMFPRVIATDTSAACRRVTLDRCREYGIENVDAYEAYFPVPGARSTAALVWGNLYDSDWSDGSIVRHREQLRATYPIVLEGNAEGWALTRRYPNGAVSTTLDKGKLDLLG